MKIPPRLDVTFAAFAWIPNVASWMLNSVASWTLNLATRMLANSLNMPEPLVVSTGVFVYARVQEVETRAARTLCPVRLLRWLRGMSRR